tara:strand:- start:168 stop:812 length:645 start_codon:yes stop_codon:yes gene_type:complete
MRPEELAKVGQNINRNGGEVTEESIAQGVDEEMSQDRKEAIERNKERKQTAVQKDAQQKAQLKANLVKAVAESAVEVGTEVAMSDKVQAKVQAKKEARLGRRADRMEARGRDQAKVDAIRLRGAQAGFKAAQLNPQQYGQQTGAYGTPGSLYGVQTEKDADDSGLDRATGANARAANFKSQLMTNRKRSTPISAKDQYLMESRRLTDLKKQFGN